MRRGLVLPWNLACLFRTLVLSASLDSLRYGGVACAKARKLPGTLVTLMSLERHI
jgi:hypothetical protein